MVEVDGVGIVVIILVVGVFIVLVVFFVVYLFFKFIGFDYWDSGMMGKWVDYRKMKIYGLLFFLWG